MNEDTEKVSKRVREIMDSYPPPASAMDYVAEAISQALEIDVFSYNDQITHDFMMVLKAVAEKETVCTDDIANGLSIDRDYVELIQYLICNNDHAEYGTSPRCCWLTKKGEELFKVVSELASKSDKT